MTASFAFECFADQDVFRVMRDDLHLPLNPVHAFGQGEVVKLVLVERRAEIGMVDEDPLSTHHRRRDQMDVVRTMADLEVRKSGDRHLIIVKPDLERCFFRSMGLVGLESEVAKKPEDLHRILDVPNPAKHRAFRDELKRLHQVSTKSKTDTFIVELERILRGLLAS